MGIYWGAFDPPTVAHQAIIETSIKHIPLKKLFVVVNNQSYKNYTHLLHERMALIEEMLEEILDLEDRKNVEILFQTDEDKINYRAIRLMVSEPLCAVAGYDSYKAWIASSAPEERALYDAIAVVPRGDDDPLLYDANAFLLPISEEYKYVSSSKIRESK